MPRAGGASSIPGLAAITGSPACAGDDSNGLRQRRRNLLAGFDEALHGGCGLLESGLLAAIEIDLDDALDTLGADHHRDADIDVLHAVLAVEIGGAGQNAL